MRLVIQRVNRASVKVAGATIGQIGRGLLILVGLKEGDEYETVKKAAAKIVKLRIFADQEGKTNLAIKDIAGQVLSVSQFTLLADTKKGNRPSFVQAMKPVLANELWQAFNQELEKADLPVETGKFGADMEVSLVNDGPFTIVLDL